MCTLLLNAQNSEQNIRGTIVDKLSKTLIIGATVQINSIQKATLSDSVGNYSLNGILPDRYDEPFGIVDRATLIPSVLSRASRFFLLTNIVGISINIYYIL